jgi:hypothetical protein
MGSHRAEANIKVAVVGSIFFWRDIAVRAQREKVVAGAKQNRCFRAFIGINAQVVKTAEGKPFGRADDDWADIEPKVWRQDEVFV